LAIRDYEPLKLAENYVSHELNATFLEREVTLVTIFVLRKQML
jgi:hypothetical protein